MIIYLIIGLICGFICLFPFLLKKKKLDNTLLAELNKEIEETKLKLNSILSKTNQASKSLDELTEAVQDLDHQKYILSLELAKLNGQKQQIEENIKTDQRLAKQSVDAIYKNSYDNMVNNLDQESERLSKKFQQASKDYEEQYELMLKEYAQNFIKSNEELQKQIETTRNQLNIEHSKALAAIEANKREEEKQLAQNKYKIALQDIDLQEIAQLKSLIPHLRNSRPISKIIWEVYYRQPANDLIARVIGPGPHCGIYKITNLLNKKTYIGQSTDIGERWKAHIKCGLGIDTPNNLLYKAMLKDGVENFSFEVLEECLRNRLNEQEIYWIDYYKSQDYGYNMTKGGSKC